MVVVKDFNIISNFGIRRKLGAVGDPDPYNIYGIYQIRSKGGHQTQVKEVFYVPTNPNSKQQRANRRKFRFGVTAWQNLSEAEKEVYNQRAIGKQMFGYNLFLREYMLG